MTGLARFTAIVFILLGIVLLVAGAGLAYRGLLDSNRAPSAPSLTPDMGLITAFGVMIGGAALAFQGLVLAAVGQGLWLMASMTDKAQLSVEYLTELVNRMGNVRH